MMSALIWREYKDEEGARILAANSSWHDEGSPFEFRIRVEKNGTCIEQSDGELILGERRSWLSVEHAKRAMQADHLGMLAEEDE